VGKRGWISTAKFESVAAIEVIEKHTPPVVVRISAAILAFNVL
jgi:hypothetical protein